MTWVDSTIAFSIIAFIILITWSRLMGQSMLETFQEIKDILKEVIGSE